MGREAGRVGGSKKPRLGHSQSSHEAYTMAHATLVGHRGSGSNPRSPPHNWYPPLVPLFQLSFWSVGKMSSRKVDQLTFDTLGMDSY